MRAIRFPSLSLGAFVWALALAFYIGVPHLKAQQVSSSPVSPDRVDTNAYVSCAITAASQMTPELQALLVELKTSETTQHAASELISISQSQPAVRTVLNDELAKMLLQNEDYDVMQAETMLAGDLKLEATILPLVELLNKPIHSFHSRTSRYILEDRTLTRFLELSDDPVARALYEIGGPAVPALSAPLESKNVDTRRRAIRILLRMKTPESRMLLEKHLPAETDAELRNYLVANKIGSAH